MAGNHKNEPEMGARQACAGSCLMGTTGPAPAIPARVP